MATTITRTAPAKLGTLNADGFTASTSGHSPTFSSEDNLSTAFPASKNNEPSADTRLSRGQIVGMAVGPVTILIIGAVSWFLYQQKNRVRNKMQHEAGRTLENADESDFIDIGGMSTSSMRTSGFATSDPDDERVMPRRHERKVKGFSTLWQTMI
ncbi:MAG: hypothetical protein Q9214_007715 [Letrouitia sp. 1 TL-2023]